MAEHLARIIGTEEDRVNCPFYWKIGACRHGDQCSRSHYKPTASPTLILRHMYQNPPVAVAVAEGQQVSDELLDQAADHFEAFYEEVFEELANYGEIEDMVVCDNIGDHIIGNVYVKFADEEAAARALQKLSGRFYSGKQIQAEYTPVTDFREARCRQFVDGQCRRGGYCNFMHIKHVPRPLKRKLMSKMFRDHPEYLSRNRPMHGDRGDRGGERGGGGIGGGSGGGGDQYWSYRRSRSRSRSRGGGGYDRYYGSRDHHYYYYDRDRDRDRERDRYRDRERDRDRGERDKGERDDRDNGRWYGSHGYREADGRNGDSRDGYRSGGQYGVHHSYSSYHNNNQTSNYYNPYHNSNSYAHSYSPNSGRCYSPNSQSYSSHSHRRTSVADADRVPPSRHVRQSSEERRAMIAKWNEERESAAAAAAANAPNNYHSSSSNDSNHGNTNRNGGRSSRDNSNNSGNRSNQDDYVNGRKRIGHGGNRGCNDSYNYNENDYNYADENGHSG